jgi:quercetin dioxygenase-like cupin family protein
MTPPLPIARIAPSQVKAYPALGALTCQVSSAASDGACTVLELTLAPGQRAGLHVHTREQEIVWVRAGTCTVGDAEHTWPLEAGSWAIFPAHTPHRFQNTSDQPCSLLITAIPGGLDRYFAALDDAVARQDAEAIAAINADYGITFFPAA